jgi:hypothetical protein
MVFSSVWNDRWSSATMASPDWTGQRGRRACDRRPDVSDLA